MSSTTTQYFAADTSLDDKVLHHKARVSHIEHVGEGICVVGLEVKDGKFSYVAGQYVWVKFGGFEPRAYSIASAPQGNKITLHIKAVGTQGASQYVLKTLKQGNTVELSKPCGHSMWQAKQNAPLILIAGGLGIAPLKAIVEESLKHDRPVHLYWGVREKAELYLEDYFKTLAMEHGRFVYHSVIETPVLDVIDYTAHDWAACDIYLGGPRPMIEATVAKLTDHGAPTNQIFYDRL